MKKSLGRALSWVLSLSLLWGVVAPTGALAARNQERPETPVMDGVETVQNMETPIQAEPMAAAENPFTATGKYEIYPTPQSVTYGAETDTVTLPATMQVIYGEGIDVYTKDRAVEAFEQAGVTLDESATTGVKLQVSIGETGNNGKYDAYTVTVNASGVSVVGKDTDAAFYGLTTMKRILQQVEDKQVRYLTVADYADVPFRGFIEGYYGNPWTVDDRAALMEFGGELKQNIYFYAPKDDPKHSSKWRELYTDAELETLIRPLAEAGNKSKCYYGFALHPFWAEGINYADETQYQVDLGVLKAKFEQVMSVGVRQIAILADDRGLPTVNSSYSEAQNTRASYVKLMKDLTDWVSSDEMQAKYPGLKTSIPFCPNDYMNDATSDQIATLVAELPASVPIIQTGGRIWGQVSHSYLSSYRTNTNGGGTFMWVNWPCSDKSKGSLTMGAHDIVLHDDLTDEDIATLKGIMLNPMQQSEPSKQAIFTNADYSWNIWNGTDAQERKDNAWNDSFKYVDHDSAIETAESAALREMGKHMIHQNGSVGWHEDYPESKELSPKLSAFQTKLAAGTLTDADITAIREEFVTLHDAAVLYKNKTTGNLRILGQRKTGGYVDAQEQMAPWLDYWEEFAQSNLDLLDALSLMQSNADGSRDGDIVEKYLAGQGNLTAARNHSFLYMDHDETAIAGGMYIVPFTNELLGVVAETAKTILNPSVLIETIITNRADTPDGGLAAMRDGSTATEAIFKSGSKIDIGDYVGVRYNRVIDLTSVRFEVGRNGNADDSFNGAKLQYMDENGQWQDIPGGNFPNRVATMEVTGLELKAKGVRAIATAAVTGKWFGIKEIYINGESGEAETGPETATGQLTGTVIKTSRFSVWDSTNNPESSLTDNDDSTSVWYKDTDNKSIVGDYVGLDLGRVVNNVGRVRFVVGNGSSADKWTNFKLQYSTDNTNWTDAGTFSSSNNQDVIEADLGGVEARYVRFVNTQEVAKWLYFAELSVWADDSANIMYQSETVKKITNPTGALEDDSATLSAENVSLRPGEFVGIALPRIREIVEIVADYTPAPGVVLKVGMSEAEMVTVNLAARAGYSGMARYIRLENVGDQTVSFKLNELSAKSEEVEGIHLEEEMTNMGFDADYGYQDNRENLAFFDGNMSTTTILAHAQVEGVYVTYDLGQLRPIQKLAMAMNESEKNYMRHGVLEVSPTGADGSWITVVTVNNNGAAESEVKDGAASDPSLKLGVPSQNCVAFVGALGEAVEARYLRIRVTAAGSKFVSAAEILINTESLNEMEYVRSTNDPTFETDPIEGSAEYTPDKMTDGDLTTGFRPNMTGKESGYLTYRFSDETSIGQINIIQDTANPSDATVEIRTVKGWQTLDDTLTKGLNQIMIPADVADVLEIKLSWGNVTPTFYEMIAVPREAVAAGGGQAPSDIETIPINSYTGTDRVFNFDENWKFNLGDASDADKAVYNDAAWRTVNLPHDYSIEGEYTSAGEAESGYLLGGVGWYRKSFTVDEGWQNKVVTLNFGGVYMDCEVYLNGVKLGEHHYGYTPFSFVLSNLNYGGENVIAVRVDNPVPSSRWYSGSGIYRSTHLTVTDRVHVAKYGTYVTTTNAGQVTVKTTVENGGTGAANDVTVKQEIFELDGATYEKTGTAKATVTSAATNVAANGSEVVTQTLNVSSPKLWNSWDKGDPNLYVLKTTVLVGGVEKDVYETEFGFRTIAWDADKGFKLNGEFVKLKGACQHHDQGGLGAEAWYRALERQVDILMSMGCNAIRVTHNPAADELIEICNRKGMLISDEAFDGWSVSKNGNSNDFGRWFNQTIASDNALVGKKENQKWYQFAWETMLNRDKNAPCVIMYSMGNEIQEGASFGSDFLAIADDLIDIKKAIDNTRFLTKGDNERDTSANNNGAINQKIMDAGGIVGFNYAQSVDSGGAAFRDQFPTAHSKGWRLYGSETASHLNTRGVYDRKVGGSAGDKGDGLLTAYDKSSVGWGQTASWAWWDTIRFDYNGGEFIWTGFDYIGEPTPYNETVSGQSRYWSGSFDLAAKSSYFGAIDTNGLPKDNYWLYRSMWNEKAHTLHILPTWDEEDIVIENGKVEVVVYSDAPMVKLYLNDVEVGSATATTKNSSANVHTYRTFNTGTGCFVQKAATSHETLYATFNVPYEAGTLRAEACDASGNSLNWVTQGRSEVKTTDRASKLVAEADRATIKNDGRDLSYVTISVTDKDGNIVNGAKDPITVSVTGNGVLMALDNGVQSDHTSYLSKTMKAGAGQLVAIVQSTKDEGTFTLTATASGLTPTSVTVKTSGAASSTTGTTPVSYELSKNIYVQLNTAPDLPATTTVNLADGTSVTKNITWNPYDESLLKTAGSEFAITGTIQDYNISVSIGIVVLDDIAALLNYSTAVRVGQTPVLPDSRPAVMADGTVVSAQFHVDWTMPDPTVYNKAGTVVVNGTAEAFGKTYTVTATVRVSKGEYTVGGNVSGAAVSPTVNGVPDNNLLRAFDGSTNTAWTGTGTAQVQFDTAQNLYRIVLTYATTVPTGTNAPIITLSGSPIDVKPKISGTTATYELGDVNSSVEVALTFASQVSLANVELIVATPVFPIGATAEFDGLKLNGQEVTAAELASKRIKTTAENAIITPVSDDNVAVTRLPENGESKIIIVTESEDHADREVYIIQLGAPTDVAATDASRDYPYAQTTATAGSEQSGSAAGSAIDGNESTIWHSAYSGSSPEAGASDKLTGFPEKRWFQLELQQPTDLVALRYKPRASQTNGTVKEYKIEVSEDGKTWRTVATGTWDSSAAWKIAMFETTVTAKYVKLWGISTYGDQGQDNYFMTAAEVRVVMAAEADKTDLSAATITLSKDTFHWKNVELRPGDRENPTNVDEDVTVTVSLYGEELEYGVDYELDYDNNTDPGTAYIYARAPESSTKYQGAAAAQFQIVKAESKILSFESRTVRVYPGVAPTLPEVVWARMDDGHRISMPIIWGDVPEEWYNYPEVATRTLEGDIEDPEMLSTPELKPSITLNFVLFQSTNGVSVVTSAGVAPVLPSTVTVNFSDGTSAVRAVIWDLESVSFDEAGTVTVSGKIEGVTLDGAKASVRVVGGDELVENTDNIAQNTSTATYTGTGDNLKLTAMAEKFPFALAYWSSGNNNPYQAIKGQTEASRDVDKRWSDWEQGNVTHATTWMGVAFETSTANVAAAQNQILTLVPHLVYKAKVMFVDESGTGGPVTFPASYEIQYYTGPVDDLTFDTRTTNNDTAPGNGRVRSWTGSPLNDDANWTDVDVIGPQPDVPTSNGQMLTVEFAPVNTAILRVYCTAQSGNHWVGVQAFEVYEKTIPTHSDFTVTSITLGGEEKLSDFQDKVLEVELAQGVAIPQLAVSADNNASVAITQASRVPGAAEVGGAWAQAVVTSEDGTKTETYTVKFTRQGATSGYFVDLDVPAAIADKIKVTPNGGAVGTEITVTAAPGYQLGEVLVRITDGEDAGEYVTVSNGKFRMPAGNVSLSATVTPISYRITYNLNGGTVSSSNLTSYTVETASFTLRNPTRADYTFQGWVGTGLATPTKTVRIEKGSMGERTYIAVWTANGDGSGGDAPGTGGNTGGGTGVTLPPNTIVDDEGNKITTTENGKGTTVATLMPDGTSTTVTTAPTGEQTAEVSLSKNAAGTVELVMPELKAGDSTETAPEVKVKNPSGNSVSVVIPIEGGETVVAVRVEEDGTETVVPMSLVDENGLHVKIEEDATLKIVDNKKTFIDVPDTFWGAGAVDFVASRELFNGVAERIFAPSQTMNRAMLVTVLWRMKETPESDVDIAFADVKAGAYYEEAVRWGTENKVVEGTDKGFEPEGEITREMMAAFLYRMAGSPKVVDEMPQRFADADQVSGWAQTAMTWAVQNDIIQGRDGNRLAAKDTATRAEAAAMLRRFISQQL